MCFSDVENSGAVTHEIQRKYAAAGEPPAEEYNRDAVLSEGNEHIDAMSVSSPLNCIKSFQQSRKDTLKEVNGENNCEVNQCQMDLPFNTSVQESVARSTSVGCTQSSKLSYTSLSNAHPVLDISSSVSSPITKPAAGCLHFQEQSAGTMLFQVNDKPSDRLYNQ